MKTALKLLLSILITYLLIAFVAWDITAIRRMGEIYWVFRGFSLIGFIILSSFVYTIIDDIEENI